jgi:hypothetical protein
MVGLLTTHSAMSRSCTITCSASGCNVDVGGLCLSARRLMYEEEYYRSITSTSLLASAPLRVWLVQLIIHESGNQIYSCPQTDCVC